VNGTFTFRIRFDVDVEPTEFNDALRRLGDEARALVAQLVGDEPVTLEVRILAGQEPTGGAHHVSTESPAVSGWFTDSHGREIDNS
jgi:hypothetical protein